MRKGKGEVRARFKEMKERAYLVFSKEDLDAMSEMIRKDGIYAVAYFNATKVMKSNTIQLSLNKELRCEC